MDFGAFYEFRIELSCLCLCLWGKTLTCCPINQLLKVALESRRVTSTSCTLIICPPKRVNNDAFLYNFGKLIKHVYYVSHLCVYAFNCAFRTTCPICQLFQIVAHYNNSESVSLLRFVCVCVCVFLLFDNLIGLNSFVVTRIPCGSQTGPITAQLWCGTRGVWADSSCTDIYIIW